MVAEVLLVLILCLINNEFRTWIRLALISLMTGLGLGFGFWASKHFLDKKLGKSV